MWTHYFRSPEPPELLVGLYTQWVSILDFGPTQAERVLLHTDVMATAHERRFAICESGQSLTYSATEHCARMASFMDTLERQFKSDDSPSAPLKIEVEEDDYLLGMSSVPDTALATPVECLLDQLEVSVEDTIQPAKEVPNRSCLPCDCGRLLIQIDSSATSSDSMDRTDQEIEERLRSIKRKRTRSRSHSPSEGRPRQLKAVRLRREGAAISCHRNNKHLDDKLSVQFLVS